MNQLLSVSAQQAADPTDKLPPPLGGLATASDAPGHAAAGVPRG